MTKNAYVMETEDDIDSYVPFVVNKSMSFGEDTISYANLMNAQPWADKKLQYDFYYHGVPKKNRKSNFWIKKGNKTSDDFAIVKAYYKQSDAKTKEIVDILTGEQIKRLSELMYRGGIVK